MEPTGTEPAEGDHNVVRVRAQVMTREDSTGGWTPTGGNNLSEVSIRRRSRPPEEGEEPSGKSRHDYWIVAKKISDGEILFSCTVKKDIEYHKATSTFHHWQTDQKRYGLTFQATGDARAFDKGVRVAVEDLSEGVINTSPCNVSKCLEDGDEDVFMTLDLPQEPKDSRSSTDSNSSGKSGPADPLKASRLAYKEKPLDPLRPPVFDPKRSQWPSEYVQFQARHEYFYVDNPLGAQPPLPPAWESPSALKKSPPTLSQPLSEVFKPVMKRPQYHVCRHCNESFSRERNERGACKYAPDTVRSIVQWISCLPLVNCLMYHCTADSEGDFQRSPCRCQDEDEPSDACVRRWCGLTFLSIVVPCIWLYPPLKLCHSCGVRCGVWGGRHKATTESA